MPTHKKVVKTKQTKKSKLKKTSKPIIRKIKSNYLSVLKVLLISLTALLVIFFLKSKILNEDSLQINNVTTYNNTSIWHASDYLCRSEIEITSTKTKDTQYVAKVQLTENQFFNQLNYGCTINNQGKDILFYDKNGNILPHTIEKWNYNQKNASLHVRLRNLVPRQSIYMYFSNPAILVSNENPNLTYDYFNNFNTFAPTVKFGIFTDIHHDSRENHYWNAPDGKQAALRNALGRMNIITSAMNTWGADFLISLGDLITAENFTPQNHPAYPANPVLMTGELTTQQSEYDLYQKSYTDMQQIENAFKNFNGNRYYVHSNHDFYYLSENQLISGNSPILGGQGAKGNTNGVGEYAKKSYFSFTKGGVTFIGLDLQYNPNTGLHRGPEGSSNYGEGFMPNWQLQWLRDTLANTSTPVIILSPSHLENSDFLEDELPLENNFCNSEWSNNYCTNTNCNSNPQNCINLCKELGAYRRVKNAREIRAVLEQHKNKIMAVFQGNDHARSHYVLNGINYITLDGAESINDNDVSYIQIEIDANIKLMSLKSYGRDNTYYIGYENGKMIVNSSIRNEFIFAPIFWGQTWNNDLMIHANWEVNPTSFGQQLGLGFFTDGDRKLIRHRCAENFRPRKNNLVGIRRVYANSGTNNFIGTEIIKNGNSTTTLNTGTTNTSGTFWAQHSGSQAYFWHATGNIGGFLGGITTNIPKMMPGVWVYNNTNAKIDNLTIRTAVYPEPTSTILLIEKK